MNNAVETPKSSERFPHLWSYYVTMAVDIILLYVLNNLIYMGIPALNTGRYVSSLWAINLALSAGVIGNFVFLLYRSRWYHHFTQMIFNFLAVIAFFVIYRWFPFDINSDSIQSVIKIILILAMIAPAIGGLIELVRFAIALFKQENPPIPPATPLPPISPESTSPEGLLPMLPPEDRSSLPEKLTLPQPAASPEGQKPAETNPPTNPEAGNSGTGPSIQSDADKPQSN